MEPPIAMLRFPSKNTHSYKLKGVRILSVRLKGEKFPSKAEELDYPIWMRN